MDLGHFLRVMSRYKLIVTVGFAVSVSLTLLTIYKVDVGQGFKLSHRQPQQWQATATVFVTQEGFPWGRTVAQFIPGNSAKAQPSVPVADADRLATLTALYAQLAMGDPIRRELQGVDAGTTTVTVAPVPSPPYVNPAILPLLTIAGIAPTEPEAVALTNRATDKFRAWLERKQIAANIPPHQRVAIEIVDRAREAKLAGHRSKTLPGVIFLGLMSAMFGLVFALENLNPRVPVKPAEETRIPQPAASRLAS